MWRRLNWLYGPPPMLDGSEQPSWRYMRSQVMDPDTVRDIIRILESDYPRVEVRRVGNVPLTSEEIARFNDLSDWERKRLIIVGIEPGVQQSPDEMVVVRLDSVDFLRIYSWGNDPAGDTPASLSGRTGAQIVEHIHQKLRDEARPRINWRWQIAKLLWLGYVALLASWVWFAIAQRPPLSLLVTGSLVVAAHAITAVIVVRHLEAQYRTHSPGNRIRSITRAELRQQRADRRANLKVAALTTVVATPISGLIGAGLTWVISR